MTEPDCDRMLDEICVKTKEVASLFEISISASTNFEAILKKANETLVELTLRTQQQAASEGVEIVIDALQHRIGDGEGIEPMAGVLLLGVHAHQGGVARLPARHLRLDLPGIDQPNAGLHEAPLGRTEL